MEQHTVKLGARNQTKCATVRVQDGNFACLLALVQNARVHSYSRADEKNASLQ